MSGVKRKKSQLSWVEKKKDIRRQEQHCCRQNVQKGYGPQRKPRRQGDDDAMKCCVRGNGGSEPSLAPAAVSLTPRCHPLTAWPFPYNPPSRKHCNRPQPPR